MSAKVGKQFFTEDLNLLQSAALDDPAFKGDLVLHLRFFQTKFRRIHTEFPAPSDAKLEAIRSYIDGVTAYVRETLKEWKRRAPVAGREQFNRVLVLAPMACKVVIPNDPALDPGG